MNYYVYTPLIAASIQLALIYFVLRSNPKALLNRLCAGFLVGTAMWALAIFAMRSSSNLNSALWWDRLALSTGPWVSILFYHMVLELTKTNKRRWFLPTGYAVSAIFSSLAFTPFIMTAIRWQPYGYAPSYGRLSVALFLWVFTLITVALYLLIRFYQTTAISEKRGQAVLFISGVSLTLVGGITDFLRSFWLVLPPLGIIGNAIFGCCIAAAIIRYRFLGVYEAFRKGLTYTLVSGLLVGIYVLLVFLLSRVLKIPEIPLLINAILVAILAAFLHPLLFRAQEVTDRVFYSERYSQLKALEEFSRQSHRIGDLNQLSASLVSLVKAALRCRSVYLLMPRNPKGDFGLVASAPAKIGNPSFHLRANSPVIRWLRREDTFLSSQDMGVVPTLQTISAREQRALAQLDTNLFVPVKTGDELAGVIALGPKYTGRSYSEDDKRVLAVIARQMAVTLDNALLYEKLRQTYEELQTTQEHLVQSEKLGALGKMSSGIAHDFNNALTTILARAQLALGAVDDNKIKRHLQLIEQATLDAAQMVRRLQDFARVRTDRVFSSVDLNQVMKSAVEILQPRLSERREIENTPIKLNLSLGEVGFVQGNESELREALVNIMINAIEAMPLGGTLSITTQLRENSATISISDTGTGMTDEVKRRLFEPFFTTKGARGLGMGLSVSYGIVKRHGGDIEVVSRPQKGTTFTVILPLASEREPLTSAHLLWSNPEKATILIIDDDPGSRDVLSEILTGAGLSVDIATGGREGLAFVQQKEYDLVITDLGMPGISGRDVAAAVKKGSPQTPVILITGWGVQIDRQESGVDGIVAKPFRKEEILSQIAQLFTAKTFPARGN